MEAIAPAAGQVKVRMRSTGVCHSDMSAMAGILPAALPAVLGHEGAGDVIEVGEGVTRIKVGDRGHRGVGAALRRLQDVPAR